MVGIPSLPAYVTKILSVTYFANFGLYCPEWQFNGTVFRDAQLNRFSCSFGSRSEFTDNLKRLTSRHSDCRLFRLRAASCWNDCMTSRKSIRRCVASHVAYVVGAGRRESGLSVRAMDA